jgi:hypothetical protein
MVRNRNLSFIDCIHWVACIYLMVQGYVHLLEPNMIATWFKVGHRYSDETKDFARLLGISMLTQAAMATVIPVTVKDMKTKVAFTWVNMLYSFASFSYRCFMYSSERFHREQDYGLQPSVGFLLPMAFDLIFALLYARCIQYYGKLVADEAAAAVVVSGATGTAPGAADRPKDNIKKKSK